MNIEIHDTALLGSTPSNHDGQHAARITHGTGVARLFPTGLPRLQCSRQALEVAYTFHSIRKLQHYVTTLVLQLLRLLIPGFVVSPPGLHGFHSPFSRISQKFSASAIWRLNGTWPGCRFSVAYSLGAWLSLTCKKFALFVGNQGFRLSNWS